MICCSGAAQLRCSLQWQQPFLELVLVCMKSQKAAHDDLLVPLKQQLITFLGAHEKVKQILHVVAFLCLLYHLLMLLCNNKLYCHFIVLISTFRKGHQRMNRPE